ncbi:MAG: metallophosphatase domain-containing protein, partial [Chitinophagaceae bacterium]
RLKLPAGDVLLHAGDISYKGKKTEVIDFLGWFAALPHKHKIFIAGNHDFYFEKEKLSNIQTLVPEGVTYLQDSEVVINGIKIWGSPVTPYFFNWAFNRKRGSGIRKHWDLIPQDADIILTHGPVYGLLDTVKNRNTGCVDLLHTIETVQPKFHVCGHIHEGYGKAKRSSTQLINASVLNELYELVNKPIVFEL